MQIKTLLLQQSITVILICLLSAVCSAQSSADRTPEAHTGFMRQQLTIAESYMVATANPYASKAAQHILQRGGNAVDAAIAANMVLTLVEPQSSGLGGGSFLLFWENEQKILHSYDGRETAPQQVEQDLFYENDRPQDFQKAVAGGRAVGVPGLVKNLELVHQKHGRLAWRELFGEAIDLAEKGFLVSPRLSALLQGKSQEKLQRNRQAREYFYPEGIPVAPGQRLKNPALAQTLRLIAQYGSDGFYRGELARNMVRIVTSDQNPGQLSLDDLASYRAVARTPVCSSFYRYRVCGMGPPSSGGITLLQLLKILEHAAIDLQNQGTVQAVHLFAQAGRLAFADRATYIADADFVDVPVAGLLDSDYLRSRAALIDPLRDGGKAVAGIPPELSDIHHKTGYNPEQPGTSHLSIVDQYGNAVSQTASIEQAFGCGLMVGGFLLNNELTDFSFAWQDQDGNAISNRVEGGKRPRSSMAPTMVFEQDDELKMVIGSPGGSRIIPYVAQAIIGSLLWEQDIQTAINEPHYLHTNGAGLDLESGTVLELLKPELERRGYQVTIRDLNSGLQGILRSEKGLEGGADPRREGLVIGE